MRSAESALEPPRSTGVAGRPDYSSDDGPTLIHPHNFRPLIETAQDGWSLNQVGRVAHPAVADGTGSLSVAPLGGPTLVHSIKFVPLIETARTIGH